MTHHFLLHGSLRPTNPEKNLNPDNVQVQLSSKAEPSCSVLIASNEGSVETAHLQRLV